MLCCRLWAGCFWWRADVAAAVELAAVAVAVAAVHIEWTVVGQMLISGH